MTPIQSPTRLVKTQTGGWQLTRHGQPFLILGGELFNSSLSSAAYMRTQWPVLKDHGLNTVLGAVTWEQIEPVEGSFDFTELDACLDDCAANGMSLILLWFGSFKNGDSSYVPHWVRKDTERFPRAHVKDKTGYIRPKNVLSVFDANNMDADARAFSALMQHLAKTDGERGIVLMVQVENEPGLTGSSRDYGPSAKGVYHEQVPRALIDTLLAERASLHPELQRSLENCQFWSTATKSQEGTWSDIFGDSIQSDEIFMAYHYAIYLERVTSSGKTEYSIPMYTNA